MGDARPRQGDLHQGVVFPKVLSPPSKKSAVTESIVKLCDALLALGEVSLENEDYTQAIEDFSNCLEKRKQTLPVDSRSIAETECQLGLAQAQSGNVKDAEASREKTSKRKFRSFWSLRSLRSMRRSGKAKDEQLGSSSIDCPKVSLCGADRGCGLNLPDDAA